MKFIEQMREVQGGTRSIEDQKQNSKTKDNQEGLQTTQNTNMTPLFSYI